MPTFDDFIANGNWHSKPLKRLQSKIKSSRGKNWREVASGVEVVGISVKTQESNPRAYLRVERMERYELVLVTRA
jgi:hypothetical protein